MQPADQKNPVAPVQPIDRHQQQRVLDATRNQLHRGAEIFAIELRPVTIHFDLGGCSAGVYRNRQGNRSIHYNPYLFAKYFGDNLATTVPHEVAHYFTDILYDLRRIRPHGAEWKQVMLALGAEPNVTGRYDLHGIPVRRQRRFRYRCGCHIHLLTTTRHNRIHRGTASYLCRSCGEKLVYAEEPADG